MQKTLDEMLGALSDADVGMPSANLERGVWSKLRRPRAAPAPRSPSRSPWP